MSAAKPAARIFRWLRQVARNHVALPKIAFSYAISLTPYLDKRGIAYLDQFRESQNLGVSDRHLRTGRSALIEHGHIEEAGRNRSGNVFDRIVLRPEQGVPVEEGVPPEQGVPVGPEQGVPTDSLDESLDPLARAKATRIPDNFDWNDATRRLYEELFGTNARFEFEQCCDYWRKTPGRKALKADWQAEARYWGRRQHEMRRGQQAFAFSFSEPKSQTQGAAHGSAGTDMQGAADDLVEELRHQQARDTA
jgi:hypothetical protein